MGILVGPRPEDLDRVLNKESGLLGVSGISGDMREILAAIEAVAAGLVVLHPQDLPVLASERALPLAQQTLSPREIQVLSMLAEGVGNKTIAWKLGISEHTVKFHVASIMTKLNAGSRTEAVTQGIRRGLILI